jgi:hypothetical protein
MSIFVLFVFIVFEVQKYKNPLGAQKKWQEKFPILELFY